MPVPSRSRAGLALRGARARAGMAALWGMCSLLLGLVAAPAAAAPTPAGTAVVNIARATWLTPGGTPVTTDSNAVTVLTVPTPTRGVLTLSVPRPGSGTDPLEAGQCIDGTAGLVTLPAPVATGRPIAPGTPVALQPSAVFHAGDALTITVQDSDRNRDAAVRETLEVVVAAAVTGDSERVVLRETAANSGVFVGYVPTRAAGATLSNCVLEVARDSTFTTTYTDALNPADTAAAGGLFNPLGRVFDAYSGQPVSGARVRLVDAATGLPATVLGDDGTSSFPAEVTSGAQAVDSGGTLYQLPPGAFRFPLVPNAGQYRLIVEPPPGHTFPSARDATALDTVPGAPWRLGDGAYGRAYGIPVPPEANLDVPLDPAGGPLVLDKQVSRTEASVGDSLQYQLVLRNTGPNPVADWRITDLLPVGFRYVAGSTRVDNATAGNPAIAVDGRTLTFSGGLLAAGATVRLDYVAAVGAGAGQGDAVNTASAAGAGGVSSNTAAARVRVREVFFTSRGFLLGRVFQGDCDKPDGEPVADVRLFMDDGRYVVTDKNGRYHFDDLGDGARVVRLDAATLPENLEVVACDEPSRASHKPGTRMFDLRAGGLARADFRVRLKAPPQGQVALRWTRNEPGTASGVTLQWRVDGVPVRNARLLLQSGDAAGLRRAVEPLAGSGYKVQAYEGAWTVTLGDVAAATQGGIPLAIAAPVEAVLTFDTPVAPRQRTGTASSAGAELEDTPWQATQTQGLHQVARPRPVVVPVAVADLPPLETLPAIDSLSSVRQFVLPSMALQAAIPAAHVAVAHKPGETIELLLNGKAVDDVQRDTPVTNTPRTLVVSRWRGVELVEGENLFTAVVRDAAGAEVERLVRRLHYGGRPVRAVVDLAASTLVADGRTHPVLALRLYDRFGHQARPGTQGQVRVESPYRTWREVEALRENPLLQVGDRTPVWRVDADGLARIELEPTPQSGTAVVRLSFGERREQEVRAFLEPAARDWILVAVAEGTAAHAKINGAQEALPQDERDAGVITDGRASFFAKGRVKGGFLLTVGYDSRRQRGREAGLAADARGAIDPDAYYTLYGDASESRDEAPSRRPLYIKLERRQFQALFGDFETGFTVTELSRYSRRLNGARVQAERDVSFGKVEVQGFAAETRQSFSRVELRGDGTSGPYAIAGAAVLVGSDRLRVEVRDRLRPERIVETRQLERHLDYDIDYVAGTVLLRRPLETRDDALNPVFLVAEFESAAGGESALTAGVRASAEWGASDLTLGATALHEGATTPGADDRRLGGVDARWRPRPGTEVRAEVAHTTGAAPASGNSPTPVADQGTAWLVQVEQVDEHLEGRAYARSQDAGFGLGQVSGLESGTRRIGAEARLRLGKDWSVDSEVFRQESLDVDAERRLAALQLRWQRAGTLLSGGVRRVDERADGEKARATQATLAAGTELFGGKLALKAQAELALQADDTSPDFPAQVTLGADWRIAQATTLYAEATHADGDTTRGDRIRYGVRATPWSGGQVDSSLETAFGESGTRLYSTLGLLQGFRLGERWAFDVGVQDHDLLRDPGSVIANPGAPPVVGELENFTSAFVGTAYRAEAWTGSLRLEYRDGERADRRALTAALVRDLASGRALSLQARALRTTLAAGAGTATRTDESQELRMGIAYRPEGSRWVWVSRTDLLRDAGRSADVTTVGSGEVIDLRVVENLHAHLQLNPRTQVALQFGAKLGQQTYGGRGYGGAAFLLAGEVRRDFGTRWDFGVHAGVLRETRTETAQWQLGADLGRTFGDDLWVSVGYNALGYSDPDFAAGRATTQGPYVRLRVKFDETSMRGWLQDLSR